MWNHRGNEKSIIALTGNEKNQSAFKCIMRLLVSFALITSYYFYTDSRIDVKFLATRDAFNFIAKKR